MYLIPAAAKGTVYPRLVRNTDACTDTVGIFGCTETVVWTGTLSAAASTIPGIAIIPRACGCRPAFVESSRINTGIRYKVQLGLRSDKENKRRQDLQPKTKALHCSKACSINSILKAQKDRRLLRDGQAALGDYEPQERRKSVPWDCQKSLVKTVDFPNQEQTDSDLLQLGAMA